MLEKPPTSLELLARLEKLLTALEGAAGVKPLLVDAKGVGLMLGCSDRQVRRMRAAGEIPVPFTVGGGDATRWRVVDLEEYVRCGCNMARFRATQARR